MTPNEILSQVITHNKYARFIDEENRRETWEEIVDRNHRMHDNKFKDNPAVRMQLNRVYKNTVLNKGALPSMRSLQFAGLPIERNNARMYNCSFLHLNDEYDFAETMFLLLSGTGVGYSVQKQHVAKLPKILKFRDTDSYVVPDTIEGWAEAIRHLMWGAFNGVRMEFDYSEIRPKGARLVVSGGKAPSADPLREAIESIRAILIKAQGRKLRTIEVHDIMCFIAQAVLSGGIRRSAMISLFSWNDFDMLEAKKGQFWIENGQRGMANNSVCLTRDMTFEYEHVMDYCIASKTGEPAVYWTNDLDWGTNPCCEVGLKPYQFCNLVEINGGAIKTNIDFFKACEDASFIATLQASYTDFTYLRPIWKETTEEEALIGVGVTGIAELGFLTEQDIRTGATIVKDYNEYWANVIGINPSSRCTVVKPSGTSSLVMGTSSGIHAWHNKYFVRGVQINKEEGIYQYLKIMFPDLIEDYRAHKNTAFFRMPQKAPEGAVIRTESLDDMLDRILLWNESWVGFGHRKGKNTNNVSATIPVRHESEWEKLKTWGYENRHKYNGVSFYPYDSAVYEQTPLTDSTEEEYNQLAQFCVNINTAHIVEFSGANMTENVACSGGACEIV